MNTFQWIFAVSLFFYRAVMIGVSLWAQRKISNHEDYLVAGRRLPTRQVISNHHLQTWQRYTVAPGP